MTVGFYLLDTRTLDSMAGYAGARALVRSVRAAMPDVPVVQFTDEASPAVEGVDGVRRKPREAMALLRMRHHAGVQGDWLFVDTDVLIQRDVRDVFRKPFDLAIPDRVWPHLRPSSGFTRRMPFNMGVVFSRCRAFWADVYWRLLQRPKAERRWMGDQEMFCEVLAEHRHKVRTLPGLTYNFPPALEGDDLTASAALEPDAAIVHFKGPQRKPLMLTRIGERVPPCA